jgi:uncharacterized phage protein (TIGR01671 family)
MNREIKFRAKRLDTGGWVQGSLIKIYDYDGSEIKKWLILPEFSDELRFDDAINEDFYIPVNINDNWGTAYGALEVDPKTIGEYTGSKDEHGRMIFEGDICRDDDSFTAEGGYDIGVVKWDNNNASFYFMMLPHTNGLNFDDANPEKFMTIIGNIHDNPELLEER